MFKTHITLEELKKCIKDNCCEPPVVEKTQMIELINRIIKLEEKLNV